MHSELSRLRRGATVFACGLTLLGVTACGSSSSKSKSTPTGTAAVASTPTATTSSSTPTSTGASSTPTSTSATSTGAGTTSGGSVANTAYAKQVEALVATFRSAATTFSGAASGSPEALATASKTLADASDTFANQLAGLTPPANVANAQTILVQTVHQFATDLRKLSKDAAAKDVSAVKADSADIVSLQTKLQQAEAAIQK